MRHNLFWLKALKTSFIAIIMSAGIIAANAAELVVISSSSPDFKVGQVVDSAKDIKLPSDASVVLMSEAGKVISLKGPHNGPLDVTDSATDSDGLIPSISDIFTREKTESGSLGVMRSLNDGTGFPEDPWAINVSKSGQYCVTLSRAVVLWRPDSRKNSRLILTNTDNDKEVKTVWHTGQKNLYWPRLMRLVSGVTYRADLSSETKLTKLTIRLVPELATSAHIAVWMAGHGCEKQALRLLGSLK